VTPLANSRLVPAVSPWPVTYTYSPHHHHHSLAILPFYDLHCTVLRPYINRTLVIGTVNRLQATQPIHRASNPIRGKRPLLSTQPPDGLWGPPSSYFMSTGDVSLVAKNTVGRRIWPLTPIWCTEINPLNAQLNPICHLLALLGTHHILHVSRIRVKDKWSYPSTNLHVLMARKVTTLTRKGKGRGKVHSN